MTTTATKRFKKIVHYFSVRGHSFLPCDTDFGSVKIVVRRNYRIYLPEEYEQMMLGSRKVLPFSLTTRKYDDISDLKTGGRNFIKKNIKAVDEPKANFTISQYNQFTYRSGTPGYLTTNDFIGSFLSYTFKLMKSNANPQIIPTEKTYIKAVPINGS
nr:unnamed protein product [Callosobruchus chinensis]